MAFNDDLSAFFDTGEFADSITIAGHAAVGILDDLRGEGFSFETSSPIYHVPAAQIADNYTPQQGDTLIAPSGTYTIREAHLDRESNMDGIYLLVLEQ